MADSQENNVNIEKIINDRSDVFASMYEHEWGSTPYGSTGTYSVGDVMIDRNRNGRDNKWAQRKMQSTEIAEIMTALGVPLSKSTKFSECAEVLLFAISSDKKMKLRNAWFCKDKLCPVCQWRRSLQMGYYNNQIIKQAKSDKRANKGKYVFLTLTVKNCIGRDLKKTIQMMLKGFDRLFRRAALKKYVIGYIRSLEVTYNEKTREFHPHLHILMLMDRSYWSRKNVDGKYKLVPFLSHSEIVRMWQQSCKLDYEPNVDIRTVKKRNGKSLEKAVLEVSKYAFKPIAIKNLSDYDKRYVISSLIVGLARVRQVGYGGLFKEIYRELKDEDENLVRVSEEAEGSFDAERYAFSAYGYKSRKYYWMHKK